MSVPLKSTKNIQASLHLKVAIVWLIACVVMFIYALFTDPLLLLFAVPFSAIALGFLWISIKPFLVLRKISPAEVILSVDKPRVGERFIIFSRQTAVSPISILDHTLTLVFREWATETRGTDTTTETESTVIHMHSYGPMQKNTGEVIERQWEVQIPSDAMHSFEGRKNRLHWVIQTKVTLAGWPAYEDEFVFMVAPERVEE
ncbi:MAG: hypothetical protein ABIY70_14540 [Capsulimonas sp.]|uniref:hypothetical protein n=1 Tax=Capsulimonas sp. TaxID=2494211 RepID=UPI0032652D0C